MNKECYVVIEVSEIPNIERATYIKSVFLDYNKALEYVSNMGETFGTTYEIERTLLTK